MRYLLLIPAIAMLAACDNLGPNTNRVVDSTTGVQLIPHDSSRQAMPVQPTDTTAPANMPTVDPDTSSVQPK